MAVILIDAGPLIALLSERDRHHDACRRALESVTEALRTVWPALTEASHLLASVSREAPADLLEMVSSGAIELAALESEDAARMGELMRKYADLPMDLADAALVRVAEREGISTIFTLDRRDFALYRPAHVRRFDLIP